MLLQRIKQIASTDLAKVFLLVFVSKIIMFTLISFGSDFIEFGADVYFGSNFKYRAYTVDQVFDKSLQESLPFMLTPFDAQWYIQIAEEGYNSFALILEPRNVVFYPLFPILIHSVNYLTHNSEWSGLLIANLCTFGMGYFLFRLLKKDGEEETSWNTVILLLSAPMAIFFSAVYTESLFLMITLWSFEAVRENKWWLAGILGFFASITKIQGIILFPVFLVEYFLLHREEKSWFLPENMKKIPWLFLIPAGLLSFCTYMYSLTGDFFASFHVQQDFGVGRMLGFHPEQLLYTITHLTTWHSSYASPFDLFMFLLSLFLFGVGIKTLRPSYSVYTACMILLPVSTWTLMSYSRYVMMAFPLFFVVAQFFEKRKSWFPLTLLLSAGFMGIFTMMFINWRWVG